MHVVVGRTAGVFAVGEEHRLAAVGRRLDPHDVSHPIRIAARQIDQDAVESVTPGQA